MDRIQFLIVLAVLASAARTSGPPDPTIGINVTSPDAPERAPPRR